MKPKRKSSVARTPKPTGIAGVGNDLIRGAKRVSKFFKAHWIGTVFFLLATLIFFWPIVVRIGTYSEGGDAMFNAWEMSRNQHCLLRQNCPDYRQANIYYPHKDTMLYSESQMSPAAITLPLHFIDQNPIFAYNVWTITSLFLTGWFMYLLVKRLSKGNELMAILAGAIFEFAPLKMAAIFHLQNISIFCLPLAVLLIYKYFEQGRKVFLVGLLATLIFQFNASWYQMVFVLIGLGIFVLGNAVFRLVKWKPALIVLAVMMVAAATTLPLARQYARFSKENNATFHVADQVLYSSSLADYFTPHKGTLLGKVYYANNKRFPINSYNVDSFSYMGVGLYITAVGLLIASFRKRKKSKVERAQYYQLVILALIGLAGVIVSFGPLLKIGGSHTYAVLADGSKVVIPMPYILVDKLVPQLSFIRATGRAAVLLLFSLCVMLAYVPAYLKNVRKNYRVGLVALLCFSVVFELMPVHHVTMSTKPYNYNLTVPAVYKYIKDHKEVDSIVILNPDYDYPGAPIPVARAEQVLWSGYHNKDIFNGYSGYTPPTYVRDFEDYVDFNQDDISRLHQDHIHYVLVDKQLSTNKPWVLGRVSSLLPDQVYSDSRYSLFRVN